MSGSLRIRVEDEATGTVVAEYSGIPHEVAMRAMALIRPHLALFAHLGRARRVIDACRDLVQPAKKRKP